MVLTIVTYPDPRLGKKSQKAQFDDNLQGLVQNMLDTINAFKDPQAAGLSAIQVGVPVRVLIARDFSNAIDELQTTPLPEDGRAFARNRDFILVNPKFVSLSKEEDLDWEGCLSFPDLYGKVWRAKKIKLKYQNPQGDEQRLTASGFLARVIQHEMDHLDGVTFNTKLAGKMHKGEELEKGTKIVD